MPATLPKFRAFRTRFGGHFTGRCLPSLQIFLLVSSYRSTLNYSAVAEGPLRAHSLLCPNRPPLLILTNRLIVSVCSVYLVLPAGPGACTRRDVEEIFANDSHAILSLACGRGSAGAGAGRPGPGRRASEDRGRRCQGRRGGLWRGH